MVLNDAKEKQGGSVELRPLPSSSLEYAYTDEQGQPQKILRCHILYLYIFDQTV